jgi:hypothetical protein
MLLDDLLPTYDFNERHAIFVRLLASGCST